MNMEFTVEELYYMRRAIDSFACGLEEYIEEHGKSALDPSVYQRILDRIESTIDKEKAAINPQPGSTFPQSFLF